MKTLSLVLALILAVSPGCHGFTDGMCDYLTKLDCNKRPHSRVFYVCGTDGQTYNTRCSLNKKTCTDNVHIDHIGKCGPSQAQRFEKVVCEYIDHIICHGIDPVCGTDNISYDNGCQLVKAHCKNKNILEAYRGFCVQPTTHQPVIDDICRMLNKTTCHGVNPVCDMNNVSYDNECEFEKAKCTKPDLNIKKMGVC